MLRTAPEPVDVQDLQFKLRCRVKVFDNRDASLFSQPCNLVACASRFGLIFVGTNTADFQVIQLKHLEKFSKSDGDKADYARRNVQLPSAPKHLSVNCEHTILAVVVEKNGCPCALFYDTKSFWQQNFAQVAEVRLSPTPGVYVTETNWNPALGTIFTACKSDGTLGIYEIKNPGIDINELPSAAGATSFCWSPKGKQIAVGSRDGKITQYKPDLKAVKVINAPPLKEPHSLISLQWISNYQFIGVYQPSNPDNQCCLIVVEAPKTGEPIYMNYDDICYSNGNIRPNQFYTILQANWNILMVASSNSMEVGILGNSGERWTQWIMGDAARAELPLSSDHQETLPIGFGLDIGNTQPLPWGESSLPPCPFLLMLSHHGTLCCFNIINLKEGAPSVCTPPDPIADTSGLQNFIAKSTTVQEGAPSVSASPHPIADTTGLQHFMAKSTTVQVPPKIASAPEPKPPTFPTTQASTLFGGQATLIPVNKSTPIPQSIYPTLPYQPLYPSLSGEAKTPQPATPVVNLTITTKTVPQPVPKPVQLPKPSEETPKPETVNLDLKAEQEAEALFSQLVKEECVFIESGLKAVLHQGKALKINLGTEDEKAKLVDHVKLIQEFFKELADLCMTQNAEVHVLKQNLLQSWAWYEEVKSRFAASKNESMVVLLRAQPLDSASEKQLEDIRHANYYLESQIAQAHRALDEQWESFQDYCKKTHKMQIPTMEMIFQTMVKQNAILGKQSYVLKDIASRIKNKSRSLLLSVAANADLPDELKRLRLNPEDICQIQYDRVVTRIESFTKPKTAELRRFLKKRRCSHVSAAKPQLSSSSSVIQAASPASKFKQLLEAKTSPIAKKLDFVQSTPKPVLVKSEATPIDGLRNFALKFEAKNFNNKEKTFTPLTKSGIASSPNSAFVSTSFPVVSTSASFKPVVFGSPATAAPVVAKTVSQENQAVFASTSSASIAKPALPTFTAPKTVASTVASVAKPTFSFTLPSSTSSVFKTATTTTPKTEVTKSVDLVTSKSETSLNLTTSTKPSDTSKFISVTSFAFATVTAAPFSVTSSTSTASIFGGGNTAEKTTEAVITVPVPAAKPFIFSSVGTVNPTTSVTVAPNRVTTTTTSAPIQSFSFVTATSTVADSLKSTSDSVTITPIITTKAATQTVTTVSSSPSLFITSTAPPVSKSPLFGNFTVSSAPQSSIFGTVTTTPVTKPSVFVTQPTQPEKSSVTPTVTTVTTSSVFGTTFVTTTTAQSPTTSANLVFGNSPSTKPSIFSNESGKTLVFGSTAPATFVTTTPPAFGTTTNQTAIFGTTATSNSQSIFGNVSSSASTAPAFGMFADGTQKTSIFGAATSTNAATPSVFGSSTPSPSVFGGTTTAPAAPFGQTSPVFEPPKSTPSVFGSSGFGSASSFGGGSSVFGSSAPTFGNASIFGSTATTSSGSIFGGTPTTSFGASTSVFGTPAASTNSVFGGSFSTTSTQPSTFAPASSGSFGFGGLNVGSTTTSAFGATPPNPFGGGGENKSVFGGSTGTTSSVFGSSGGSIFGSTSQSFGSSTFGTQPVFGQQSTFGQSSFGGGTFGQQSPGPFSGGSSGSVAQSGFGGTTPFQKPGSFGGSPVFGSTPSFGSPPSFGGAPAFGSSPTFGGTAKIFGGGNAAFGNAPSAQNTAFGNLANQQTVGFGNLAQQASTAPSPSAPFSGNSSFSSWR